MPGGRFVLFLLSVLQPGKEERPPVRKLVAKSASVACRVTAQRRADDVDFVPGGLGLNIIHRIIVKNYVSNSIYLPVVVEQAN